MQPIFVARSGLDVSMTKAFIDAWVGPARSAHPEIEPREDWKDEFERLARWVGPARSAHPEIEPREDWKDEFERLARDASCVVFMVSQRFLASEHCMWEYGWVRARQIRSAVILFPDADRSVLEADLVVSWTDGLATLVDKIAVLVES